MKLATLSLLCLAPWMLAAPAPQGVPAQPHAAPLAPCANPIAHEALVVWEVSGGTLLGPVDGLLVVYSDGIARYSSSLGPGPGFAQTAYVGAAAQTLHQTLVAAGALRQCDIELITSDVPLSTLTVLRNAPSGLANQFSWTLAEGNIVPMEAALNAFVATVFPGAPGGGTGS